jgi:hypothetical protein
MQYKAIKNCHVENAVPKKDFNLGMTILFFMLSPHNLIMKLNLKN